MTSKGQKKPKAKKAKDLNDLLRRSMSGGAIDLQKMQSHEVRDKYGIPHDVESGPCACGAWH